MRYPPWEDMISQPLEAQTYNCLIIRAAVCDNPVTNLHVLSRNIAGSRHATSIHGVEYGSIDVFLG